MNLSKSIRSFSGNFSHWRLAFQKDAVLLFQGWEGAEARGRWQLMCGEKSSSFQQKTNKILNRKGLLRKQDWERSKCSHESSLWIFSSWSAAVNIYSIHEIHQVSICKIMWICFQFNSRNQRNAQRKKNAFKKDKQISVMEESDKK